MKTVIPVLLLCLMVGCQTFRQVEGEILTNAEQATTTEAAQ